MEADLHLCREYTCLYLAGFLNDQGPVVQSIVSVMMLSKCGLHYYIHRYLLLVKCENLLHISIFPTKKPAYS